MRGGLQWRTEGNKVVTFEGATGLIGQFVHVRLDGTTGSTFTGSRVVDGIAQRVA